MRTRQIDLIESFGGGDHSTIGAIQNTQMLLFPKWRQGIAQVGERIANAKILCIGDSIEAGYSPGTGTSDSVHYSRAYQMAYALLTTYNIPTLWQNTLGIGNGASGDDVGKDNTRLTIGAGWSYTSDFSVGGKMFTASGATSSLAHAFTAPVNTINIYYKTVSGGGTFSAAFGSATATNQSTNAATGIATLTITTTIAARHTLNLNYVSGGAVTIIGWDAFNSAQKAVQVYNAGWGGSSSVEWAGTNGTYFPIEGIKHIAPDLTIISIGVNDMRAGTALATFTTNMQSIITAALVSGDVILEYPAAMATSEVVQATQQTYIDVLRSLRSLNNVAEIDLWSRWGGLFTVGDALGFMGDTIHPNNQGYVDQSQLRIAVVMPATIAPQRTAQGVVREMNTDDFYRIQGHNALRFMHNDSGTYGASMAIGRSALSGQSGANAAYFNLAIGLQAMGNGNVMTTAAVRCTAIGYRALSALTTGPDNTAIGPQACLNNTTGQGNFGIGRLALQNNQTGEYNVAIGTFSMQGSGNSSHSYSVGVGTSTLASITTGDGNTAIGAFAGGSITSGGTNTIIGINCGGTLTTGSGNIFIGVDNTCVAPATNTANTIRIKGISGGQDYLYGTGGNSVPAVGLGGNPAATLVNGSTSGTANYSQPIQCSNYKKVIVYLSALLGTASYTFPTPFTNTPVINTTNGLAAAIITALSTTAMTCTGTTTTGFLIVEGY